MKFIYGICVCFLVFNSAFSQDQQQLERQRKQLNAEIEITSQILQESQAKKKSSLDEYVLLENQISQRNHLLETLDKELEDTDHNIRYTEQILDSLSITKEGLKQSYNSLLRKRYIRNKQASDWQMYLSADGFRDAFLQWQYARQLDLHFEQKKQELEAVTQEYEQLATTLGLERSAQDSLVTQERTHQLDLEKDLENKKEIINDLSSREQELRLALNKKNKAREDLNRAIESAIEAALAAKRSSTISKPATPERVSSTSSSFTQRQLAWPSTDRLIVGRFGKQAHPTIKGLFIENNGIDILLKQNKEVSVVAEGNVLSIQTIPGHDIMIMVQHGEFYTIYSKLKTSFVKAGQTVSVGQAIGEVTTDDKGNAKLHFEIWRGKTKLDPSAWLK